MSHATYHNDDGTPVRTRTGVSPRNVFDRTNVRPPIGKGPHINKTQAVTLANETRIFPPAQVTVTKAVSEMQRQTEFKRRFPNHSNSDPIKPPVLPGDPGRPIHPVKRKTSTPKRGPKED